MLVVLIIIAVLLLIILLNLNSIARSIPVVEGNKNKRQAETVLLLRGIKALLVEIKDE